MPTFLAPSPGGWVFPTPQANVFPNAFYINLPYDPATMPNPAVRYSDLYAVLKTPYAGDNYPVFPGSELETLVNLLEGPSYDLDAINAAGVAVMASALNASVATTSNTVLAVARDGYFDFTDALSQYTGISRTFGFGLAAFLPFTVEEQGGCSVVIRPAAYKQTKLSDLGVPYERGTNAVPLLWSQLAAALKPSNLVAQFARGVYPTPADFQRAAAETDLSVYGYGLNQFNTGTSISGGSLSVAWTTWGILTGTYVVLNGTNQNDAFNPFFADGDFGGTFTRLSCAHSIIK